MDRSFDPVAYAIQVGQELVSSFQGAGFATAPGQIGSAREVPVREKLEQLLPKGLTVGSGFVIDSFGNSSRQMDVILYERDYCPVYCINRDPSATYYPCEGVIAVGEVKSSITSTELSDIFAKLASVKRLRRFVQLSDGLVQPSDSTFAFRSYGSPQSVVGVKVEEYGQEAKPSDQIFGFALAGSLDLSGRTFCDRFAGLARETGYPFSPNLIVTLGSGILCPSFLPPTRENPIIKLALQGANSIYYVEHQDNSFQFLLSRLYRAYRSGRTVPTVAFDRYFARDGRLTLPGNGTLVEL